MEIFIILLVLSFVLLVVFAIGLSGRRGEDVQTVSEIDGLDELEIKPEWVRCAIRAERDNGEEGGWVNVRLQFFTKNQNYVRLTGERCSNEELADLESRLLAEGWTKHGEGTSEQVPEGFERVERAVIYTRGGTQ